ncbi:MAG: hypothetical protein IPN06_15190 [Burkholderiales bacterium]|nr:hypothetical protein [Burkholderiales bacterium]
MNLAMMKTSMLVFPALWLAACGGGGSSGGATSTTPTATSTSYLSVVAGGGHTVAIKSDGTLLAWGLNRNGQLGDGTSVDKATPTQVGVSTAATGSLVSAGEFHTMALSSCATAGCTMWAWGSNDSGRLGDGTAVEKRSPTKLTGSAWTDVVAGGNHTLAIKKDSSSGGTLWAWGRNDKGQLGLGTGATATNYDTKTSPTAVMATVKTWSAIAAGSLHSLAVYGGGSLSAWGANNRGQLGVNNLATDVSYVAPVSTGAFKVASIAAGGDHSLAIFNNGSLWAWGANGFGQLGIGTLVDGYAPVQVGTDTDWESISAGGGHNEAGNDLASNGGHSLAIKTNGTLWAWGSNANGQLGTGTTDDATAPTQVGTDRDWKRVSAGKLHSFAWKADGSLWAWGNNLNGQLGNGSSGTSAPNILVPTRMP